MILGRDAKARLGNFLRGQDPPQRAPMAEGLRAPPPRNRRLKAHPWRSLSARQVAIDRGSLRSVP